ncbi:MAG TPA: hypothetical protein VL551_28820 [Actinospica sp.]|jgi:hypothetical protein|nr:hypothetical protein [Actinospica sp.]
MELTQYVENLRRELTTAAEVGGAEARELADRLLAPLDAAVRLTLLEALSSAAEEISAELAPGSVDVRLRGGTAGFVVTPPPAAAEPAVPDSAAPVEVRLPIAEGDEAAMVRINLRLPANLKALIEDAAAGGGLSVNAWIVRAAAAGLANEGRRARSASSNTQKPDRAVGQGYSGWAR